MLDKDNHADYYEDGEVHMYCDECDNLMVPTGSGRYRCPVCGSEERSPLQLGYIKIRVNCSSEVKE